MSKKEASLDNVLEKLTPKELANIIRYDLSEGVWELDLDENKIELAEFLWECHEKGMSGMEVMSIFSNWLISKTEPKKQKEILKILLEDLLKNFREYSKKMFNVEIKKHDRREATSFVNHVGYYTPYTKRHYVELFTFYIAELVNIVAYNYHKQLHKPLMELYQKCIEHKEIGNSKTSYDQRSLIQWFLWSMKEKIQNEK